MPTIQNFINAATEHSRNSKDQKVRLLEVRPDVLEIETGDVYFLEPVQPKIWSGLATQFNFNKHSFRQYCERLAPEEATLDAGYVHACGQPLGLQQLQFWNEVNREREAFLRLRVYPDKNGRTDVRAVLSGLYQPIDAAQVGLHLKELIDEDKTIEYTITEEFWHLVFWESLRTDKRSYNIGFRVMGSEIGNMRHVRFDVLLQFHVGKQEVVLPLLIDKQPLATIPYSGAGAEALSRLDMALQRGLQAAEEVQEAVQHRRTQDLKYPADEYYELVNTRKLPSSLKALPTETPQRFASIKTKFDLACVVADIAAETSGRTRLRIEAAAGLYLLTGRLRTKNRNYDDEAEIA